MRWAVLILACAAGCKGGPPHLDPSDLHPYRPAPTPSGELEGLPGRTLLAVTRKQCLAAAFNSGRLNAENFRARLGAYFYEIPTATAGFDRTLVHTSLEPSMELLRLSEEMVVAVDQQYWALRAAYAVYLCKASAADAARELETIAEKLVAAGRQTRADLEKAKQTRIGYDTDREAALHGDGGLLDCEAKLRHTIGYSDCVPGLLLPADGLPVAADTSCGCGGLLEFARDHRLELLTARYRIVAAEGKVIAAKDDDKDTEREKVQHAKNYYAGWEQRVAMDIQFALDRVSAASRMGSLIAERRGSVARQLADFEKLAKEDALNRAELIEARIRLALITAEEHQAVGTYLGAVSDLDRVTGAVLSRDGVKLPSPRRAAVPRPWLTEEPLPPAVVLNGVVRPKFDALATGDPFAPLPQWLAPLAK
jgi:hypothetical protein